MNDIPGESLEERRQRHVFMAPWQGLGLGHVHMLTVRSCTSAFVLVQNKAIPKDEAKLGNQRTLPSSNGSSSSFIKSLES